MSSSEFATLFGRSSFADSTTVPAIWSASDSEHSALHKPSHAVQWQPALRPQDRRTNRALVSVVLITVAVLASAAMLALNS